MPEATRVVLDSSVGAKWFRDEPGSDDARGLLGSHGRGEIAIVVASLFVYELLGVASRQMSGDELAELWRRFVDWRIRVRELDAEIVPSALRVRERLGCSVYDAFAPAIAEELDAVLYSADHRAHGDWPGVVLVG